MKLYFSSNQFSQLQQYSFADRQQIISLATAMLKPTSKIVLNIIKLLILIPPFMMLANIDSWMFVFPLVFVLVGYFLVLRPFSLFFIHQHLDNAVAEFEKQ